MTYELDLPGRPPIATRTCWEGLRDAEHAARSFDELHRVMTELTENYARYPCALRMHAADAYELGADEKFVASLAFGQIIGHIYSMAIILDPQGVMGVVELEICGGCQEILSTCDYAAPIKDRHELVPVILGGKGLTTAELLDDYTRPSRELLEAAREKWGAALRPLLQAAMELER